MAVFYEEQVRGFGPTLGGQIISGHDHNVRDHRVTLEMPRQAICLPEVSFPVLVKSTLHVEYVKHV